MTDDEIRLKIAEACPDMVNQKGPVIGELYWLHNGRLTIFDPLNDLNAINAAEKTLTREQAVKFRLLLSANSDGRKATYPTVEAAMCHATARHRSEAFLATI